MTLQECYAALGGNYEEVRGRLMTDRLVQKFLLKFLDDKSYELLCQSLEAGDTETAFRAAHTLKGVCQNLNLDRLFASSNEMTELLRGGGGGDHTALLAQVTEDYNSTIQAIEAYRDSAE